MSSESQVGFDVLPGLELLSSEKGLEEQCITLQSVLDSLRPNAPSRQIGTVARGGRASSISTESGTLYDDVGIKEAVILGVEDDSMQPLLLKLASGDPSGERDYSRPSSPSRPADDAAAGSMRPGYLSDDCNEESFHELGQKEPQPEAFVMRAEKHDKMTRSCFPEAPTHSNHTTAETSNDSGSSTKRKFDEVDIIFAQAPTSPAKKMKKTQRELIPEVYIDITPKMRKVMSFARPSRDMPLLWGSNDKVKYERFDDRPHRSSRWFPTAEDLFDGELSDLSDSENEDAVRVPRDYSIGSDTEVEGLLDNLAWNDDEDILMANPGPSSSVEEAKVDYGLRETAVLSSTPEEVVTKDQCCNGAAVLSSPLKRTKNRSYTKARMAFVSKRAKPQLGRTLITKVGVHKRLQGYEAYPIDLDPLIRDVMVTREFMSETYGTSMHAFYPDITRYKRAFLGGHRHHFLFPNLQLNPEAPRQPGAPGLLCRATDRAPWGDLAMKVLVRIRDNHWHYMGDYKTIKAEPLSVEEFLALPESTQRAWARKVTQKKRNRQVRVRVGLRLELGREPSAAEVDKDIRTKRMFPNLTEEDFLHAYTSGQENIQIWCLVCVGYGHAFQRELAMKYKSFVPKEKGEKKKDQHHGWLGHFLRRVSCGLNRFLH